MAILPIVQFNASNQRTCTWTPTSFSELEGKYEKDLEDMIASDLATLGIEDLANPKRCYHIIRQCQIPRQKGANIIPDIIVVRDDGEIFIIEVKLSSNRDLFDRKAISQLIDYASTITQLSEYEIAPILSRGDVAPKSNIGELFDHWFITSNYVTPNRVRNARHFVENITSGKINLILVSDVLPSGAYNWIDEWSNRSHLPFNISAIEVTPFVNQHDDSFLLIPQTKIETAIISRTVVEVKQLSDVVIPRISISPASEVIESTDLKSLKKKRFEFQDLLSDVCDLASQQSLGWETRKFSHWEDLRRGFNNHNCIFRIYTKQ